MDYEFVVTSNNPVNTSQGNRQLVRKRASQAAARTRKREARFIGVNQLQVPVWLETDHNYASAQSSHPLCIEPREQSGPLASLNRTLSPIPSRFLLPLRALRELLAFSKYDMSKLLLNHDKLSPILSDPLRTQKVLNLANEQFFLGLGESCEANRSVNTAVDCLWAYLEELLSVGLSSANTIQHVKYYVRALNSIRSALDEGTCTNSIDVWYATLILILYESLNPSGNGWILHACGAIHVLEHLGPRSITTEGSRKLLTAQIPPMITESIFQNKSCFLSQPQWQDALRGTIIQDSTLHNRSEAVVTLWMHAAHIPDIFRDVTNLLIHKGSVDHDSLSSRIKSVHENYQDWYSRWQSQLESAVMELSKFQFRDNTKSRIELLCCYLEHFCIIQRLLACLNPNASVDLEEGVAESAQRILEIYEQYTENGEPKYHLTTSVFIARSVLASTDQWKVGTSDSSADFSIAPGIFLEWCKIMGRSVD